MRELGRSRDGSKFFECITAPENLKNVQIRQILMVPKIEKPTIEESEIGIKNEIDCIETVPKAYHSENVSTLKMR